jgi:hypothetical protein
MQRTVKKSNAVTRVWSLKCTPQMLVTKYFPPWDYSYVSNPNKLKERNTSTIQVKSLPLPLYYARLHVDKHIGVISMS